MRVRRNLLALGFAAAAGWSGLTSGLAAQVLRVRALAQGRPLAGALVSLRDPADRVVVRLLANDFGVARVVAPGPGAFRVRVDAIGYRGSGSEAFHLAAGDSVSVQLDLEPHLLLLADLVVASNLQVCDLQGADGTVLAQIWDEARKGLLSATLSRSISLLLETRVYQRRLSASLEVLEEQVDTKVSGTTRPFVAADAELLHRHGYVQRADADYVYYGPDADLLLSERFLEDHCFSLAARRGDSSRIGLAFRPAPKRRLPEVTGTLWLDRRSSQLEEIEFGYANIELPETNQPVGGRIEFAKLPTGAWIVSRWYIRMPRLIRHLSRIGGRDSLVGYQESGGEARPVSAFDRSLAALTGTVFDSMANHPLEGVVVSISGGAFADTTGAGGSFRLTAPTSGDFVVTFAHARFTALGLAPMLGSARLLRGTTDTVDAAIPSRATLARSLCPPDSAGRRSTLLIAYVVDSVSRQPIEGAGLTVRVADGTGPQADPPAG